MATTVRRARKQNRSVFFSPAGAVLLTIDGEESGYWLDTLAHDFGPAFRCYRLDKFKAQRKPSEPDSYDVMIDTTGQAHSCECKGWLRWRKCKHVSSLLALHARDKLS